MFKAICVLWPLLMVPWDGLQCMIVEFPDHTHTLELFITNGIISSKIEDRRDDFKFGIVNFLFLDGVFLALFLMVCVFRSLYVL